MGHTLTEIGLRYRSIFVAEVSFMHGDAAHYDVEEYVMEDDAALETFWQFVDAYSDLPWNIKCCKHDKVEVLPGYWLIFTSAESNEEFLGDNFWGEDYWPRNVVYGGDSMAMMDTFEVFWYDENGKKFAVIRKQA